MANFKETVYNDGAFYVQKQSGAFCDPLFYVTENTGEGLMVPAGTYATLEDAKEAITIWIEDARRNSGL